MTKKLVKRVMELTRQVNDSCHDIVMMKPFHLISLFICVGLDNNSLLY